MVGSNSKVYIMSWYKDEYGSTTDAAGAAIIISTFAALVIAIFFFIAWCATSDSSGHTEDVNGCIEFYHQERSWLFDSEPKQTTLYCVDARPSR